MSRTARRLSTTRVTGPMKILAASTPATGNLNPLLAIGHILIDEGHDVGFLSGSVLRDRIEGIGAKFHAFPADADLDLRSFDSVFPERTTIPPGPDLFRTIMQRDSVHLHPPQPQGLQPAPQVLPANVAIAHDFLFPSLPHLARPP